ncbi:MAG: 6-phosphofructokinase [Caldilineaceae bacterium]|nr:6-phosphofructokinase [Caldilineaceae bacterium]
MTSGGDAPGMNATLRAVVRTALAHGVDIYAIHEGYQGLVDGGDRIRKMHSTDVGGILHQGGTIIGTARCAEFRMREGRLRAARHLVERGIDGLVVIGGDGSLTGANLLREEWSSLLDELVETGQISAEQIAGHRALSLVGLVGSIDNDMFGTEMTIGADTALHRIVEAVDAIISTAASHQRTFVVEVMGRNCGFLALMSAVATGANWVFIPECPPTADNWEDEMCEALNAGRSAGRRSSTVIVAEGARDRHGNPITAAYIKEVLETRTGQDTRVTILGHVQRGGSPSAYERIMAAIVGHAAAESLLTTSSEQAELIGIRQYSVTSSPLMECVEQTHHVGELIRQQRFDEAMAMRGGNFAEIYHIFQTLARAKPRRLQPEEKQLRILVLHCGAVAPGMNTAVRAAVRLGLDQGHTMLATQNGFESLQNGTLKELDWTSVTGWVSRGGAELGTSRHIPAEGELYAVAKNLSEHRIDGMLIIGGWDGYMAAHRLLDARNKFPAFQIPIICVPATISNNLPGTEHSIGADTALNSIIENVDKIKESAVANRRCFVVQVMGGSCGYLALMSGIATGAERVYLPEEGVTLEALQQDVNLLIEEFQQNKRLGLMIRNERADPLYTTDFMCALFEKEGGKLFDVRQAILGHVQQGGKPSPYDRIEATRLASKAITHLIENAIKGEPIVAAVGTQNDTITFMDITDLPLRIAHPQRRPKEQWWLGLRPMAKIVS